MPDAIKNPVSSCLFIHAGSDFDALDARFLGKGEGRGGTQIRPLGDGFYGYLARDEEEAAQALRFARAYLKHAPTQERAIHAFSVHLKPGDVQFGSVWDEALLSKADRLARDEWAAANELAPGPDRKAAYEALFSKYPRGADKPKRPFRTEVLAGIDLIEIAANDLSRLERAGKWAPSTDDAQILADMRLVLAAHQKPLEDTKVAAQANFDRWFAGSAVVDDAGAPLVLYHGTKSDFSSFDMKMFGASDEGLVGKGFYFTYNPEEASGYALNEQYGKGDGPNVIPVFLSIKNPFVITQGAMPDGRKISEIHRGGITSKVGNDVRQMIEAAGHDGVVFASTDGQVRHAIAFRAEQIKSAIGNSGAFDIQNPDITDRRAVSAQLALDWLNLGDRKAAPHA